MLPRELGPEGNYGIDILGPYQDYWVENAWFRIFMLSTEGTPNEIYVQDRFNLNPVSTSPWDYFPEWKFNRVQEYLAVAAGNTAGPRDLFLNFSSANGWTQNVDPELMALGYQGSASYNVEPMKQGDVEGVDYRLRQFFWRRQRRSVG